ncbi:PGF-pre-PGF domain-containing protein [Candidatus Halobonum tyrrellensis]|uniref:CARDB domain-containing protein n=1 Tax=Candidatus Halobonum tyrrellensis G22 TaxID=1324957 RepID=V4J3F2_9EURY|nr:PGF-pre-PGF domain-containing protein [Candidatus Halobonum tyrrellensis]ESP89912.1 hypothetical protein K933_01782 [Candidatus Halobonum tyrrellensis G22]
MPTFRSAVALALVVVVVASGVTAGVTPAAVTIPGDDRVASPPSGGGHGNGNGPDGTGPPGHAGSEDGDDDDEDDESGEDADDGGTSEEAGAGGGSGDGGEGNPDGETNGKSAEETAASSGADGSDGAAGSSGASAGVGTEADDGEGSDDSPGGGPPADAEHTGNGANPERGPPSDGEDGGEADGDEEAGGAKADDRPGRGPPANPGNRGDGAPENGEDDAAGEDDDRPGRGPPADRGNASAGPPARANASGSANASTPGRGPPTWANASESANASVSNATAGTPARVNVSGARTDDVGVNALTVTTRTNESYALNVTTSDRSPADAPEFDASPEARDGSTTTVGHVRVNHTVPDTNISGVDFDFTVNASRLAAANASPENVALYRFHDGEWAELNTTLVGEVDEGNRTVYAFVAHSPGLSDFVIGAKRAEFRLADALVSADRVTVGDTVTTRVRIRNVGGADGTFSANLLVNGTVVDDRTVTVAADGTRQVSFERPFAAAGTYAVRVNDLRAGEVRVLTAESRTESENGTTAVTAGTPTGTDPGTDARTDGATATTAPGFGPAVAVVSLLVGCVVARRRRRG